MDKKREGCGELFPKAIGLIFLISELCLFFIPCSGFSGDRSFNTYFRGSTSANSPVLLTLNGLYNFGLSELFKMQVGMRLGEESNLNFGQFNYKTEIATHRLYDHFNFMFRYTKANSFYPGTDYKTVLMSQAGFVQNLEPFILRLNGGAAFVNSADSGSIILPEFSDTAYQWIPTFLSEIAFDNTSLSEEYALRFANYDVFDVYNTNTCYFQAQIDHKFKSFTAYIYTRYRYKNEVTHPYTNYFALGAVIPL